VRNVAGRLFVNWFTAVVQSNGYSGSMQRCTVSSGKQCAGSAHHAQLFAVVLVASVALPAAGT
jgi:hypothetical protein